MTINGLSAFSPRTAPVSCARTRLLIYLRAKIEIDFQFSVLFHCPCCCQLDLYPRNLWASGTNKLISSVPRNDTPVRQLAELEQRMVKPEKCDTFQAQDPP